MIVVDTNLIAYLFLTSDRSAHAEQILRSDADWAAPLLWRSELRNVLSLYLRKQLLALADAQVIMSEALRLMHGREYEVNSEQILNLAASSTCSAYDCEFVALASDLGVPLVTVDRQLLQQFPRVAISPEQFLSLSRL